MSDLPWTPWHEVVKLREDLKSGELSLAAFAADLYEVTMERGRRVYQEPREFFALTYPTYNLRELARDVALRLAGRNEKAVRQLELTYGGGKTHTLITLYHLANDPDQLPDLPSVQEFTQHIGMTPPKARIAALCFDKLDAEKGMEVRTPGGETRWLKNPWSVLAYQIAGARGLKLLHAEGQEKERESAPAENLLVELLSLPAKEGLATLVLIDEVLMFARQKVGLDPIWRSRLVDFFQYLTQAATKVDRCAIVASLLATDPKKSDALGREITNELYAIFRREREEGVQPVLREDVAEVLRRRFFTADSIRDREAFRPHVVAALKGVSALDEQTAKEGKTAEDRFHASYPFHPALTDVFYAKWTNLDAFQRTRGVLRTFALALRDAEGWDQSPLVGANVFLTAPNTADISLATRELTAIAATEDLEGKKQEWNGILEGEMAKARAIQRDFPSLRYRELEQAVLTTFLHSQPIGRKAQTRELLVLLGPTRPDRIELEQALLRWARESWFLDDTEISEAEVGPDGQKQLPRYWRLGSRPNLKQMHDDACSRVSDDLVETRLIAGVGNLKSLTAGASAAGARVHNLPDRPKDVEDDGQFRYVVLGSRAASDVEKPGAEAVKFLTQHMDESDPRVFKNAVIMAVPSRDGLDAARGSIRAYLGWEEVRGQLAGQELDPIREQMLSANLDLARKAIPTAVRGCYSLVVTLSEKGEAEVFKVTVGSEPLFTAIKGDARSRIQETAISAEALLPEGPYSLWREGDTSRRARDLVSAFAQYPQLPKMLKPSAILDTLVNGCVEGNFVMRVTRPDRTARTFWREPPDEPALRDPTLEVVLPEAATLSDLPPAVLVPGVLPGLWETEQISVGTLLEHFAGGQVVRLKREGYEEAVTIPKAERETVEAAVKATVKNGKLWLTSGPASILAEEIPAGLLTDGAVIQAPPSPLSALAATPKELPEAWAEEVATALTISVALSKKTGRNLPWVTVRDAIDGAVRARMLELTADSGLWPCGFAGAGSVKLRPVTVVFTPPGPPPPPPQPGVLVAEAELATNEIQDLAEVIGNIRLATAGHELKFRLRIELGDSGLPPDEVVKKVNELLKGVSAKLQLR